LKTRIFGRPVTPRASLQHETVGIGRRGRHLPKGQAEAVRQQLADGDRILGRQHIGQALVGMLAQGRDHGRWGMAEHGAGIAQAEIGIGIAVHIPDPRARSMLGEDRIGRRPVRHPAHRHASGEMPLGVLRELVRFRVALGEAGPFALGHCAHSQRGDTGHAVGHGEGGSLDGHEPAAE
jgi:hypothetical protein